MESLKAMIDRHEGNRLKRYRCPAGHWTIARGWNMDSWPLPVEIAAYERLHGEITPEMSDALWEIQYDAVSRQCRDIFVDFDLFTEARQHALFDLVFNIGCSGVMAFKKMRKAIFEGDWVRAAEELKDSAYWKQLGGDRQDNVESRPEENARLLREG